jgi:signal transduction histidine kinase
MIVTAYSDIHAAIDAINRGQVTRYITKPWRDDEFRGVIRTGIEIFHLNHLIRDLESKMFHADRQVTVQVVLSKVAHEIANPLASLIANLSVIASTAKQLPRPDDDEMAGDLFEALEISAEDARLGAGHLEAIIRRMRRGDVEDAPAGGVDLRKVVEATVSIVRAEVARKARLEINAHQSPLVVADPTRVGQILVNLLLNAAEAIAAGEPKDNVIAVEIDRNGSWAQLKVRDSGCGIPKGNQESVFDPLFSTKNGVNSGLGLSITRDLVLKLGGRITMESTVGQGSVFTVELPAVDE